MNDSLNSSSGRHPRRRRSGGPAQVGRMLSGSGLAGLLEHARHLGDLGSECAACLPQTLQEHCQLVNFTGGTMVFAAASPAWAARLRLLSPGLLRCLRQRIRTPVSEIRVKVLPREAPAPEKQRHPIRLSATTGHHIASAARSVRDPGLSAALLRLAANAETDG